MSCSAQPDSDQQLVFVNEQTVRAKTGCCDQPGPEFSSRGIPPGIARSAPRAGTALCYAWGAALQTQPITSRDQTPRAQTYKPCTAGGIVAKYQRLGVRRK